MMNDKERAKLALIRGSIDGAYTAAKVAVKLGVSKRWVKQLKRMVRERQRACPEPQRAYLHTGGMNNGTAGEALQKPAGAFAALP